MRPALGLCVALLLPLVGSAQTPPAAAGPLVIVGGGKMTDDIRKAFFDLAGKDRAKIVVIPTASGDADDPKQTDSFLKQWKDLGPLSVEILHTRDAKTANDADFVKPLQEATGVWFSGGDQSRITAAYRGTRVEKELQKLHARGGVIGGTSAGAAVMSDLMITGGTDVAKTGPGLGFLPGVVVDQHFRARKREKRLAGVLVANPKYLGIGIDEGTAVVVVGDTAEVVGVSTADFYAGKDHAGLKAGEKYDLKGRKKVEK